MPPIIFYLIKFSISLFSVYLFYQLILRRLTFYTWSRWFLLGYSLLSFVIPFINISPIVEGKNLNNLKAIQYIPTIENYAPVVINKTKAPVASIAYHFDYWTLVFALLIIGSLIMLVRFFIQFLSLQKIKKNALIINNEGLHIYEVNKKIIPFSFGNAVFINPKLHNEKEFEEIILHEYVHVRQKHTIDILFSEFLCIINWYNPFAWLIRHDIRQNLEFIADDLVLKDGINKKAYQYYLLKVIGVSQYRIANNFNFSSLKKRIIMMNKLKSAKLHLTKFLFLLPLVALLLVAFRDKYKNVFNTKSSVCIIKGLIIDASTNSHLANVIVKEVNSGLQSVTNENGFYSLQIPLEKDSLRFKFHLKKDGYEDGEYEYNYSGSYKGFANVMGMFDTTSTHVHKVMMFMPGGKTFSNIPSDEDVTALYNEGLKENKETNYLINFNNKYPDLTFYCTEDKKGQIVISKDGLVEKYGYPNWANYYRHGKEIWAVAGYVH